MENIVFRFLIPVLLGTVFWGAALLLAQLIARVKSRNGKTVGSIRPRSSLAVAVLVSMVAFCVLVWSAPAAGIPFEIVTPMSAVMALAVYFGFNEQPDQIYWGLSVSALLAGVMTGIQYASWTHVVLGGLILLGLSLIVKLVARALQRSAWLHELPNFGHLSLAEIVFSAGIGFAATYPNVLLCFLLTIYAAGILGIFNLAISLVRAKELKTLSWLPYTTILTLAAMLTIALH